MIYRLAMTFRLVASSSALGQSLQVAFLHMKKPLVINGRGHRLPTPQLWRSACHIQYQGDAVLKISIQDDQDTATLKLEGKLVGPWVEELKRVWQGFEPSLQMRKLSLDICGLTFADKNGTKALRRIYHLTDAEIIADTPLTRYFAAETMRKMSRNDKKELGHA